MIKIKILLILAISCLLLTTSCTEESVAPVDPNTVKDFTFKGFTVDTDTILVYGFANIHVDVEGGSNLTYEWFHQQGTILGSGADVQFTICHAGPTYITCTVSNGVRSESKEVVITSIPRRI